MPTAVRAAPSCFSAPIISDSLAFASRRILEDAQDGVCSNCNMY